MKVVLLCLLCFVGSVVALTAPLDICTTGIDVPVPTASTPDEDRMVTRLIRALNAAKGNAADIRDGFDVLVHHPVLEALARVNAEKNCASTLTTNDINADELSIFLEAPCLFYDNTLNPRPAPAGKFPNLGFPVLATFEVSTITAKGTNVADIVDQMEIEYPGLYEYKFHNWVGVAAVQDGDDFCVAIILVHVCHSATDGGAFDSPQAAIADCDAIYSASMWVIPEIDTCHARRPDNDFLQRVVVKPATPGCYSGPIFYAATGALLCGGQALLTSPDTTDTLVLSVDIDITGETITFTPDLSGCATVELSMQRGTVTPTFAQGLEAGVEIKVTGATFEYLTKPIYLFDPSIEIAGAPSMCPVA